MIAVVEMLWLTHRARFAVGVIVRLLETPLFVMLAPMSVKSTLHGDITMSRDDDDITSVRLEYVSSTVDGSNVYMK